MSNTGFPQRQYSADSLDVKSKIASFEAFSESNTGLASPTASSALVSNSPSTMSRSSQQQQQEQYLDPEPKESTTAAASQSRKSRLQRAMNGKRHIAAHHHQEPGSLMQKRLHAKEQRLASLQQQRQQQQQQFSSSTSYEQQQMQQQRTAKEQRQPSSRHGNSRGQHPISSSGQQQQQQSSSQQQQQMSPMNAKALTSPSSLSQSRSPAHPRMQQQQTSPARRPNFNAATAAAKQHRALNYGKSSEAKSRSRHPTQQQQQQQQQQWGPNHPNNTSSSSSSHTGSSKGKSDSNMSRMSRLKAKGIDHNRFAQQRKQQQQQQFQQQPQQRPQHVSTPQRSLQATQHQTAKSQDSPDHNVLTDDDATLTSVSRVLDEQQAFTSNNNTNNINDTNRHASYSASNAVGVTANDVINGHGQPGKPPRLWTGGEEKSEKFHSNNHDLSPTPQHHYQHHAQHSNHNNHLHHHSSNGGIYPRPSSSSEFESEVQNSRQRAAGSRTGSSYQNNNDNPYAMPQGQFQQQQQQQYAPTASRYNSPQHHYHQQQNYPNQHPTSAYSPQGGMLRRSQGSYPNNSSSGQQHFYQNRLEDDDRTFDYGVKDDDSQGSTTFQQQLLEAERKAREQSHVSEANTATMSQSESPPRDRHDRDHDQDNDSHAPRLLKSDDPLEQYRQSMENPVTKTAAGVIGAATLGCFVIGPVGVLLGAAAVGIGIGVMQIPEEQRKNMVDKASETMSNVQEQAFSASETMSMSCAASYKDSGLAEHIPAEMTKFCAVSEDDLDMTANTIEPHIKSEDSEAARLDHTTGHAGGGGGDHHHLPNQEARKPISPSQARSLRSKNVACLRHGTFGKAVWNFFFSLELCYSHTHTSRVLLNSPYCLSVTNPWNGSCIATSSLA